MDKEAKVIDSARVRLNALKNPFSKEYREDFLAGYMTTIIENDCRE